MKFNSRFFCCMLCSFVLAAGSVAQVYADLPEVVGDDVVDSPVVEEIPGDPAMLLDDVPMLMSVVTPIDEFERLPTAFLYSSVVGGYAYGNSVSGDVSSPIYFFVNSSPIPRSGAVELIAELSLPGGIDKEKIYLDSTNKLRGFSIAKVDYDVNGLFKTSVIETCTGINYVNDTTVRVSFNIVNCSACMFRLSLTSSYLNGGTVNFYWRETTDVVTIGGDGGGGSGSGGAVT